MLRREFLGDALRGAAAGAIPAMGTAAAFTADGVERLSKQAEAAARQFGETLRQHGDRIRAAHRRIDSLEWRYRLLMALFVVSMLIDGGMSWMLLTQAPVVI